MCLRLDEKTKAIRIMAMTTTKAMIIHVSIDMPIIGVGVGEAPPVGTGVTPVGVNTAW